VAHADDEIGRLRFERFNFHVDRKLSLTIVANPAV
jgi:hypothetical protein